MVKRLIDLRSFDDITDARKWAEEVMQFIWSDSQKNLTDPHPTHARSPEAPMLAPISNTGFLMGSADPPAWELNRLRFIYDAPYAGYVEFGTEPHGINEAGRTNLRKWARKKLGLSGKKLDKAVEAIIWKIYKFGTPAKPYLRPAIEAARRRFNLKIRGPD